MTITFGKHKGKSEEVAVLGWPDYVSWVLAQPQPQRADDSIGGEIQGVDRSLRSKALSQDLQVRQAGNALLALSRRRDRILVVRYV